MSLQECVKGVRIGPLSCVVLCRLISSSRLVVQRVGKAAAAVGEMAFRRCCCWHCFPDGDTNTSGVMGGGGVACVVVIAVMNGGVACGVDSIAFLAIEKSFLFWIVGVKICLVGCTSRYVSSWIGERTSVRLMTGEVASAIGPRRCLDTLSFCFCCDSSSEYSWESSWRNVSCLRELGCAANVATRACISGWSWKSAIY